MIEDLDSRVMGEEIPNVDAYLGYLEKSSKHGNGHQINSRLRVPRHKTRSHTATKKEPRRRVNVQYGERISYVDSNRAIEHYVPKHQRRTLTRLLRKLKEPVEGKNRQGTLTELYEDLRNYKGSVFPTASLHNQLMSDLYAAIQSNLRVVIGLVRPEPENGKMKVGYYIKPI